MGVKRQHRAPGDFPSGKTGDVLLVEFTVMGIPCIGLNGGPTFKHNESITDPDPAVAKRAFDAMMQMKKIDVAAIEAARASAA